MSARPLSLSILSFFPCLFTYISFGPFTFMYLSLSSYLFWLSLLPLALLVLRTAHDIAISCKIASTLLGPQADADQSLLPISFRPLTIKGSTHLNFGCSSKFQSKFICCLGKYLLKPSYFIKVSSKFHVVSWQVPTKTIIFHPSFI